MHSKKQISEAFFETISRHDTVFRNEKKAQEFLLYLLSNLKAEIEIVDPSASNYNKMVGMTEQRTEVLNDNVQELFNRVKGTTTRIDDILSDLLFITKTLEEFAYALILHMELRRANNYSPLFKVQGEQYRDIESISQRRIENI